MEEKSTDKNVNIGKKENTDKDSLGLIPYIIAIGVLIAYGFFIYFLIGKADAKELDWSRLIYLFSGVEAIVFAAAGFLFGREVNRKRAENAEEEKKWADKQKQEAEKQAVEERKKALILGTMVIQEEKTTASMTPENAALEGMVSKPASMASIAKSARSMYPELKDV